MKDLSGTARCADCDSFAVYAGDGTLVIHHKAGCPERARQVAEASAEAAAEQSANAELHEIVERDFPCCDPEPAPKPARLRISRPALHVTGARPIAAKWHSNGYRSTMEDVARIIVNGESAIDRLNALRDLAEEKHGSLIFGG